MELTLIKCLALLGISATPALWAVLQRSNNPRLNTLLFFVAAMVLSGAVVTLIAP